MTRIGNSTFSTSTGRDGWVRMASTLSNDACSRPEFMLNNGSPVPKALKDIQFHP
jgi:hypothetical protein